MLDPEIHIFLIFLKGVLLGASFSIILNMGSQNANMSFVLVHIQLQFQGQEKPIACSDRHMQFQGALGQLPAAVPGRQ